ncbi:ty3/Gypsy family of RNase HI in long-term repeat domain-containing protein [Elysia marginata]|uniref:Ty3/Gypsy family of RNase HI in long-term repeat domain-containing protein n=1 Tax=Elysia marginata TaxID=1093978 RepID=A0AAV4FVG9_9GAST|nr:ty3/Gypsy family of RNase HI in long-term repeat domain-containing protein [Elysia marginata]
MIICGGAPKFLVRTDNNPLTYVLTSAKLDATGHRWLAALSAFDFEIEYTPGVSNQDADALSRLPSVRIDIAVREDNPDVSPDKQAVQKVPPSTKDQRTPKSSSATPKPVLREDGVKGTTPELEDGENGGESDSDDDEFAILVPESNVQIPESRLCEPQPLNDFQPVAEEVPVVDQNSNNVPLQPPSNLPPPVPVPRRSVRPKQPPPWQTSGEIAFSIIDKMTRYFILYTRQWAIG